MQHTTELYSSAASEQLDLQIMYNQCTVVHYMREIQRTINMLQAAILQSNHYKHPRAHSY